MISEQRTCNDYDTDLMDMLWSLEQENVNKLFYCKVASVESIDAKMNHENCEFYQSTNQITMKDEMNDKWIIKCPTTHAWAFYGSEEVERNARWKG